MLKSFPLNLKLVSRKLRKKTRKKLKFIKYYSF